MPAYSYKRRFVDPMLAGIKDGTIRAERRGRARHARAGDMIANYVGMRTKSCELILRSVCTASLAVTLVWRPRIEIIVESENWADPQLHDCFAHRDGFRDMDDMAGFWREVHAGIDRFEGRLIRWQRPPLRAEMGATVMLPKVAA